MTSFANLICWATPTGASVAGLYASYALDLPTGAAIVCAFGLALILAMLTAKFHPAKVF